MCGRFTLTIDASQIQAEFPWVVVPQQVTPRYNVAPAQPVAVIANQDAARLDFYLWGLIPSWTKDITAAKGIINARAETLAQKPSFRSAYLRRRCLIPADGFFEWQSLPAARGKQPLYFKMKSARPFAFAGIWEMWHGADGSEIRSCAIITTTPNELVAMAHNRMPVILPPSAYSTWLEPGERKPDQLQSLLQPYPAQEMTAVRVSNAVNNPRLDTPACIRADDHLDGEEQNPLLL